MTLQFFFCTQLFDAFHYIQYVRVVLYLIYCHRYNSSTIFNTPFLGCCFCLKFLLSSYFEKRLKFIPLSRNFIKKLKKISRITAFDLKIKKRSYSNLVLFQMILI